MSDEKDPVLAQIESLAVAYTKLQGSHDKPEITQHDFVNGAITQDPIAWNRCIDAVLELLRKGDSLYAWVGPGEYEHIGYSLLDKIEKMRR